MCSGDGQVVVENAIIKLPAFDLTAIQTGTLLRIGVGTIVAVRCRLDVRAARTDGQVLERTVRAVEANRVPIEEVVVANNEAVVVKGPGGEVERGAFGAAGCRNSVIPDAACFVDLLRMVV